MPDTSEYRNYVIRRVDSRLWRVETLAGGVLAERGTKKAAKRFVDLMLRQVEVRVEAVQLLSALLGMRADHQVSSAELELAAEQAASRLARKYPDFDFVPGDIIASWFNRV